MIKSNPDIGSNITYQVTIPAKTLTYGSLDNIGLRDIVNYRSGRFPKSLCFYIIEWGLFV